MPAADMAAGVIGVGGTSVPGKTGWSSGDVCAELSTLEESAGSARRGEAFRGKKDLLSFTFLIVSRACLYAWMRARHIPDKERTADRTKMAILWKDRWLDERRGNDGRPSPEDAVFCPVLSVGSGTEV